MQRAEQWLAPRVEVVFPDQSVVNAEVADTDGDGLCDGWEVLGIKQATSLYPLSPATQLPAWGADPLHKDVFVQVAAWFRPCSSSPDAPVKLLIPVNVIAPTLPPN